MSLRTSIVVKQGSTGVTLTGGSDTTFVNDGQGTNGVNVLIDSSNGNLLTRKRIATRLVRPEPAPNANSTAKLGRSAVTMHAPYVDSNGKLYKQPANFDISYHPDLTEAERLTLFWDFIAVIVDSEMGNLMSKSVND